MRTGQGEGRAARAARRARIAALLGLAATLGACTKPAPPERVLILGTSTAPTTLDPAFARLSAEREIVGLMFRDLTVLDDRWQVIPDLAATLPTATTSSAGFTARWRLRPDLAWSDGAPLTVDDVRFGWRIERDPGLEALSHETAVQVSAMRRRSATELDVVWRAPQPDYAAPRVHAVLPAHAYPKRDPKRPFVGMRAAPVGNGPFRLAAQMAGAHLTFERNPHWWGPRPALDRVIVRIFPSEDGFEAALATGAIHALGEASGLTPDRVAALSARLAASHDVVTREGGLLLHLQVRHDHPALGRLEVRRALSAAIDRAGLAEVTYDGLASPAAGLFPPRHPGHRPGASSTAFDPAAARAMVAALPAEQRVLGLGIGAGSGAAARAGAYIQAALADVGWSVKLEVAPMGTLFARMRADTHPPLVLYGWRVRPDWDGASAVATGGRLNHGHFSDPELDRRLVALEAELDPGARAAALAEVGDRIRATLPIIPLLFRQTVSVKPKRLEGWRPTGTVTPVTWSAAEWRWVR